jgi:hypothetical protein
MIEKIKRLVVRSPFHKAVVDLRSWWISTRWVDESTRILDNRTIYCISPYKTGTTFIASSFEPPISAHEPLHHASLSHLNQDFERNFVRRLNSLNLKLECSGFLSAYVENLAQTEITNDLTYICVLRNPSSWVTSVVNHYQIVKENGHRYLWDNELFWKKHAGVNLANFFVIGENEKLEIVEKLIEYYMSFTKKTEKLKNVHYVWIKDLDIFVPKIGQLIDEAANLANSDKNKALVRNYVYKNKKIDAAYEQLVCKLVGRQYNLVD